MLAQLHEQARRVARDGAPRRGGAAGSRAGGAERDAATDAGAAATAGDAGCGRHDPGAGRRAPPAGPVAPSGPGSARRPRRRRSLPRPHADRDPGGSGARQPSPPRIAHGREPARRSAGSDRRRPPRRHGEERAEKGGERAVSTAHLDDDAIEERNAARAARSRSTQATEHARVPGSRATGNVSGRTEVRRRRRRRTADRRGPALIRVAWRPDDRRAPVVGCRPAGTRPSIALLTTDDRAGPATSCARRAAWRCPIRGPPQVPSRVVSELASSPSDTAPRGRGRRASARRTRDRRTRHGSRFGQRPAPARPDGVRGGRRRAATGAVGRAPCVALRRRPDPARRRQRPRRLVGRCARRVGGRADAAGAPGAVVRRAVGRGRLGGVPLRTGHLAAALRRDGRGVPAAARRDGDPAPAPPARRPRRPDHPRGRRGVGGARDEAGPALRWGDLRRAGGAPSPGRRRHRRWCTPSCSVPCCSTTRACPR